MIAADAPARWAQLCRTIRTSADSQAQSLEWFQQLQTAYAAPDRHYHNFAHIIDCLTQFDSVRTLARSPAALEFALWFHDIIYDPRSPINEESSAALARQFLLQLGATDTFAQQVNALIIATKSHQADPGTDTALLIDIDLSIFGQPAAAFDIYETQIRQEYAWVPAATFATKRAEILRGFLARPRIYATDFFFSKFESQARANLARSLQKLDSSS
ncbi:MAG: hypothetical protein QM760_09815 [Nibricoccus sp.]